MEMPALYIRNEHRLLSSYCSRSLLQPDDFSSEFHTFALQFVQSTLNISLLLYQLLSHILFRLFFSGVSTSISFHPNSNTRSLDHPFPRGRKDFASGVLMDFFRQYRDRTTENVTPCT